MVKVNRSKIEKYINQVYSIPDETIARELLREIIWEQIDYHPHEEQQRFHNANARFNALNWGRRTGKTLGAAAEAIVEMAMPPTGMRPYRDVLITGPETDITDNVFSYLYNWITQVLKWPTQACSARQRTIITAWGSRVQGKTTDNPRSLLGPGNDLTIADEHAEDSPNILIEYLLPPTLDAKGRIILPTTPEGVNNHWNQTYHLWLTKSRSDPDYFASTVTSYANEGHGLGVGAVDKLKSEYEERGEMLYFKQEYLAEFISVSGAVIPQFDLDFHVRKFELEPGLPVYGGIDFGFEHPFVFVLAQKWGSERIVIRDCIYLRRMTDHQCALEVIKLLKKHNCRKMLKMCFADPSEPEAIAEFNVCGIPTYKANNQRQLGLALMRRQFGMRNKPGVLIHPDCNQLIAEILSWRYDPKRKDKLISEFDHGPDATRYLMKGVLDRPRITTHSVRSIFGDDY